MGGQHHPKCLCDVISIIVHRFPQIDVLNGEMVVVELESAPGIGEITRPHGGTQFISIAHSTSLADSVIKEHHRVIGLRSIESRRLAILLAIGFNETAVNGIAQIWLQCCTPNVPTAASFRAGSVSASTEYTE